MRRDGSQMPYARKNLLISSLRMRSRHDNAFVEIAAVSTRIGCAPLASIIGKQSQKYLSQHSL